MPPDAERVHGPFGGLPDRKPRFEHPDVVDAFLDFVADAPIIAHNAGFDRAFVNHELGVINRDHLRESRWIDTLALAGCASRACTIRWMRSASASRSRCRSARSTAP